MASAAPGSLSLKEYLKRYESGSGAGDPTKKKKKKKAKPKPGISGGVLVVDEDPVWQKPVQLAEEEDDDSPGEEKVIVEEDIEVKRVKRLEAIRLKKPYHAISEDGSGWVPIVDPSKPLEETAKQSDGNDLSPPRQHRARFDTPSPGREQRLKEEPYLSPPRQDQVSPRGNIAKQQVVVADFSPPRRKQKDLRDDLSPPRKTRRRSENYSDLREADAVADLSPQRRMDTPDELSPLRRRRRDTPDNLSPPRRRRRDTPDNLSPPRRRRRDTPDDLSPPRRRMDVTKELSHPQRRMDTIKDFSPPRSRRKEKPDDLSPPNQARRSSRDVNRRHGSPVADISPPRRSSEAIKSQKSNSNDDFSPPRKTRKESHSDDISPPRKSRKELHSDDISPPRKSRKELHSADISPPRKTRKESSSATEARRSGLFSAQEIKEELDMKRKLEISRFAAMDPSISGKGAEPVFRDKEGKRISKEEMMKPQEEEKPKEKKLEWGKGLAQKREAEARTMELELEKEKPFARNRDDPELDKMLKERIRWGDPMAHLVKRKHSEPVLEDLGDDEKMKESGFIIPQTIPSHSWIKRGLDFPPNRYGIRPGRHWDGVDRSNGYEKEFYKRQNEKRATEAEAYLWSVSDM